MRLGPLYMSEFPFAAGEQAREALPPEIDFLEGLPGVGLQTLEIAARKARMHGVGADEVLIAEGLIGEGDYYRALATRLACPFVARAAALAPGFAGAGLVVGKPLVENGSRHGAVVFPAARHENECRTFRASVKAV